MPSRDSRRDLMTWSGRDIVLRIDPRTLTGEIDDVRAGVRWRFAGVTAAAEPAGVQIERVEHLDEGCRASVRFGDQPCTVDIALTGKQRAVTFSISPVGDAQMASPLPFPAALYPVDRSVDELALPLKTTQGIVYRPGPSDDLDFTFDAAGGNTRGLSMPFWSVSAGRGGVLAVLETPDDVDLTVRSDAHAGVGVGIGWRASLGVLGYRRSVRFTCVPAGYQAAALAYREHVIAAGRFTSLTDKIAQRPAVRGLVGAPYFSTGYLPFSARKLKQVLGGLRGMGYTAGLVGPIDYLQWQAEPWLNDYQPFIHAPEFGPIVEEHGFTPFAWLYLEDILDFDPSFDVSMLAVDRDGTVPTGWENRDYRYHRVCDAALAGHGRRLQERAAAFTGLHFDTTTNKELMECWSPAHPMSRTQDREARSHWLAEVAGWGHLIGSEGGCDWAFDVMDFCSNNPRRGLETNFPAPAAHVPLQGLAYHDSIVSYGWEYDPYNKSYWAGDWSRDKLLYDVMCGNPPTVSPVLGYFPVITGGEQPVTSSWVTWEDPETQSLLRKAVPVAKLHEQTAFQAMVEHGYLDRDQMVSRTVYERGTEVLVNASAVGFDDGEVHLDASSYLIDGRRYRIGAS